MTATLQPVRRVDIVDVCQLVGIDADITTDYSGRGMNGDSCFGVTMPPHSVNAFLVALGALLAENSIDRGEDALDATVALGRAARTDQMGYYTIVYFPGYTVN